MKMITKTYIMAMVVMGAGASLAARGDVIIDSFTYRDATHWPISTTVTNPSLPVTTTDSDPSILGGQRTQGLGVSTMQVPGFDNVTANIDNVNPYSFLDYNSSVGAAATMELGYGQGSTPLNLVGVGAIDIYFLG